MSDQHVSPIKTPKQLVIIVVLAFVIPIVLIVLVSQLVTAGPKGEDASQEAILARIQPVGRVELAAGAGAAPAAGAPAGAAVGAKPDGKKVYDTVCMACHAAGVAGSPKFGDKALWAPRIKTGMDALYASALKGKPPGMPPKGGATTLPDADVKAAVDYMVAAAK